MMNIHKFYSHYDIRWVRLTWLAYYDNNNAPDAITFKDSFWCKDFLALSDLHEVLASGSIGNGKKLFFFFFLTFDKTIFLWKHIWEGSISEKIVLSSTLHIMKNITMEKAYNFTSNI